MTMKKAPCLDCENRELGCHIVCGQYKEFTTGSEQKRQRAREEKNLGQEADAFRFQQVFKTKRDLDMK